MYPQLEVIPGYLMMDSLAFATRLDSFKLWQSVNLFMRLVKVDGRFAALYKQWLGVDWVPNALETSI
jgi:ABC-type amino acid transport substrate-binding protein